MKKKITKGIAYLVTDGDSVKNWQPTFQFTGALAIFTTRQQAKLAVEYNQKLEKNKHRYYKIVKAELSY